MQQEELLNQLINFDFSNPDKKVDIPNGLKLYKGNSELIFIEDNDIVRLNIVMRKKDYAKDFKEYIEGIDDSIFEKVTASFPQLKALDELMKAYESHNFSKENELIRLISLFKKAVLAAYYEKIEKLK